MKMTQEEIDIEILKSNLRALATTDLITSAELASIVSDSVEFELITAEIQRRLGTKRGELS